VEVVVYNVKARPQGRVFACAGFTMVELVVTILILGIIATVAGNKFFSRNAFDELGFASAAAASVRYAQKLATTSGCNIGVKIWQDGTDGRYAVNRGVNCDETTNFSIAVAALGETSWQDTSSKALVSNGIDIYFDAVGRPYQNGSSTPSSSDAVFKVGASASNQYTVEAETGFVHQ